MTADTQASLVKTSGPMVIARWNSIMRNYYNSLLHRTASCAGDVICQDVTGKSGSSHILKRKCHLIFSV